MSASPSSARLRAGLALASAGAIAFSGKAIVAKLIYRWPIDATTLIFFRMVFALPLFALLAWWRGRGRARLSRVQFGRLLVLGFTGYYAASMLDFMGLERISASLERLILYLNPTIVLLLGALFFGRRLGSRQWLAMGLSYCGVLVVFVRELDVQGPHVVLGAALVLGSALSYATYLVLGGSLVGELGAQRLAAWAGVIASVLCIVQFVVLKPLAAALVPAPVVWLSLLNATACTVAPIMMVMMAVERIGAALTAQTGMLGPLSTIALSVWLLHEPFTSSLLLGTLFVLGGIYVLARAPA
ncbi:EamA-like transporter family protein [mine drainage metagenome]|uniref:EamA-like transporter family protein n=1 Tax=mine drainage metagenome TaxID=410659 RepID=A0A1J5R8D3_9ZZZZ